MGTFGKTCMAATAVAPLALGGSTTDTGDLPAATDEAWFQVTFGGAAAQLTYHPHIQLTTNPNSEFVFDILGSCGGAALGCGEAGQSCTNKTDWEVFYNTNGPNPPGPPDPTGNSWMPVPAVGRVWVRVHRTSSTPSCDTYSIKFSD